MKLLSEAFDTVKRVYAYEKSVKADTATLQKIMAVFAIVMILIDVENIRLGKYIIGAATSFSFRTLCSSKILRTHSSASVIAKLARFLKVLLPEEKQISFSPILYFTQYSSEYYIYQLRRILI